MRPPKGRAAIAFIFITVLLDMMAFGMVAPVLPKLVTEFVTQNAATAALTYTLFNTAFAFMQFMFSPLIGALSDRFGRRPLILASNLGLGFNYILMAWAPTIGWLFIGRVIAGVTGASYGTASAYIADTTPLEKRCGRLRHTRCGFWGRLHDRAVARRRLGGVFRCARAFLGGGGL